MSAKPEPALDRNQLILDHMALAKVIALQRMPYELHVTGQVDDAIQEAMLGLIQAAHRFKPSNGTSFQSFASFRIRGQCQDHLRRMPLVGQMREGADHSLRQVTHQADIGEGQTLDALQQQPDPRSWASPTAEAGFESLLAFVAQHCSAGTLAMIRLWCDGWPMEHIAREYGISKGGVQQRLHLAFKKTRAALL